MSESPFAIEPPVVLPGDPEIPEPLQAGLAFHRNCQSADAEKAYTGFLEQHPGHPQALSFLGAIYAGRGQHDVAAWLLSTAIQGNRKLADPRYCLANVLANQGEYLQAVAPFACAAALGHPGASKRLQALFEKLGNPARTASHRALAGYYRSLNQPGLALENATKALDILPDERLNWLTFRQCLTNVRFSGRVQPDLVAKIEAALHRENLDYRQVALAAISAMRHEERLASLYHCMADPAGAVGCFRNRLESGELAPALTHPLLLRLLEVAVITDIELEMTLTALRSAMLREIIAGLDAPVSEPYYLPLVAGMACQCFLNEYVWWLTDEERAAVDTLEGKISERLDSDQPVPASWVAITGAYKPLLATQAGERLSAIDWPQALRALVRMQLDEPAEEALIRREIPDITPITGGVSALVRSQYEEHPFPRWATVPVESDPVTLDQHMHQLFPYLDAEDMELLKHPDRPQVLVAGCGTGLIPNYIAANITGVSVTAVDLSLSSLSYAKRKSREPGIDNIEYLHGDILKLPELGRQFDHINCYGVLHHMEDTLQGWKALFQCIRPRGTMHIGLYSRIARRPVTRAHEFIRERGYRPVPDDMRRFRYDVLAQKNDALLQTLLEAPDFYSMSELRDLVFHFQEHFHTLPEIGAMIDDMGLEFLGFTLKDPTSAAGYRSAYPDDPEMLSLENWAEFEEQHPKTFASIYDFWVYRPD